MWRAACRNVAIFSLAAAPLAGCVASAGRCPPLAAYPPHVQKEAARELRALSRESAIAAMIVDYSKLRDACRAAKP